MRLAIANIQSMEDREGIGFRRLRRQSFQNPRRTLLVPLLMVPLLILIPVIFYTSYRNEFMNMSQSTESGLMYIRVETDKRIYKAGEGIRIDFYLVNNKNVDLLLPSLSRGLDISGSSGAVLLLVESHASEGPIKIAANSEYLLGSFVWNQRDMDGKQVPPGTYRVHVNLLDAECYGETSITID